ncbi:MAG: sulfotransferase [Methylovulum sp.]|nr:sulfotransferase [Methylovulum sp.]
MTKFVIGIGSQRAGSTLLYTILEHCTPIYMNPVKELHYFDTLFGVRHASVLHKFSVNQLNKDVDRIVKAKELGFLNRRFKNSLRTNFLLSTKKVQQINYIDLFRPCVHNNKSLGEITPEYMILPVNGIQDMAETIGNDAKIILLARNPVKRFVSAFKLLMHGKGDSNKALFEEEMLKLLTTPGHEEWLRVQDAFNNYELALNNYQNEFKEVLLITYDELFGAVEETAEILSAFLELEVSVPKYKKIVETKINALEETSDLSEETLSLLQTRYADNQAYLDKVFGKDACVA